MPQKDVHYSDYLQLDKILNSQQLESDLVNAHAHDEMLFIIIHQAYELWFKQIMYEIESVADIMSQQSINDNSPDLQTVAHRLNRVTVILRVAVHKIDIMETMTPMDFLDFRNLLRPASGFQSWQFKLAEARLGLRYTERHAQEYYISQLREEHVKMIKTAEAKPSLLDLVNEWLERMPFFEDKENWPTPIGDNIEQHPFWADYSARYVESLMPNERFNLRFFNQVFFGEDDNTERRLSPKACRAGLFIFLFRGYPMLQTPFQLLNLLLEIDEQLSTWRSRHVNMVHRMIGTRTGTGGSTGKDYLKGALDKHYIFKEIAGLSSFLIERQNLPQLGSTLETKLGFKV
ncbi:MAG: tryptophan 2,3-dioxygenase [Saprospiraceae bacterium]|nr:tryptophan 2,3-dioxygenase [Saprospiraceae bacterium]MCF8252481.1 tryptophan 2,3-dioxygenase [Saprospiraceae bacterium]MCF8282482.1 tryptophan 2,3-dioxygenase [Bacteroidales bacterium]MCF8312652.1 tryptophan 2,3-dioxygenase [Saprospiraceae bacterium]MCF8441082.1 tryptophan 2,3-dioxygenase [Saprospiraceae bacterium]